MSTMMEAFVGSPLPSSAFTLQPRLPHSQPTLRRARNYLIAPFARSLESYNEGSRFGDSDPRNARHSNSIRENQPRRKTHILLVSALSSLNVASIETCGFIVRSGCVKVNGAVVKNEKARINRSTDRILVNGTDYGTFEPEDGDNHIFVEEKPFDDINFLPRSRRDFRSSYLDDVGMPKKFNRRVDGGFYSSRKYHQGK